MTAPRDGARPTPPAPRVLQLALWAAPGVVWHARLVDADASVHEFDSPFELARFLAQAPAAPPREGGGLR
jgi:hypothetical protein